MNTKIYRTIYLTIVFALLLAACAPGPAANAPTLVPTVAVDLPDASTPDASQPAVQETMPAYPVETFEGGYPGPEGEEAVQPPVDPGYPGPAGAPVMENRSRVTARLVERAPDHDNPGWVRLRAEILTSDTVDQMPSFTGDKIGQEIDLYVDAAGLPDLAPGDTFGALVSYQGDESGGRFTAAEVQREE